MSPRVQFCLPLSMCNNLPGVSPDAGQGARAVGLDGPHGDQRALEAGNQTARPRRRAPPFAGITTRVD